MGVTNDRVEFALRGCRVESCHDALEHFRCLGHDITGHADVAGYLAQNARLLARELVDLAGLSSVIKIVHGTAAEILPAVAGPFGLVLIDHYASNYYDDLRRIEDLQLLAPGAVVVADNAVMHAPSMADYLTHVRDGNGYRSALHVFDVGHHGGAHDGMEISTWLGA